jgi:hypothetical protein
MEPDQVPKQKITISLEVFNKMFSVCAQSHLPFIEVNNLILEVQKEMKENAIVEPVEEKK